MNASSASGLCARRMVRLAGTRGSGGELGRLGVERVEIVLMLGVLRPLPGALGRLVPEEVRVRPPRTRGVVPQLERPGPQHRCEEMRRDGAADRVRLDRKSTRLNSSHRTISYAVFCLKKNILH